MKTRLRILHIVAIVLNALLSVKSSVAAADIQTGYAPVNGLKIYYEIHGNVSHDQTPLVLLHGGGSTIETSFGKILPALAKNRTVIAFEQQGH
ncbi:alpha/beta hydrolase [bacterium]|nr:alpha/beta hydrolase [bacterium]MCI0614194.1 alpha/beta hydrolase [bacterium]